MVSASLQVVLISQPLVPQHPSGKGASMSRGRPDLGGVWPVGTSKGRVSRRESQKSPKSNSAESPWHSEDCCRRVNSTSLHEVQTGSGQFCSAAPVPFWNFHSLSSQKENNRKEMILASFLLLSLLPFPHSLF